MNQNEQLVRDGYAAFESYDLETVQSLFADDVVWTIPAGNQLSGTYKGKDEVFGFLAKLLTISEGTFKATPVEFASSGDRVFVLTHESAQRGEKTLHSEAVAVYRVADGKAVEVNFYNADQHAADAFWS